MEWKRLEGEMKKKLIKYFEQGRKIQNISSTVKLGNIGSSLWKERWHYLFFAVQISTFYLQGNIFH